VAAIKVYEKVGFGKYNTITSPAFQQAVNSAGMINMRPSPEFLSTEGMRKSRI
jgi:hypothetical protein